MAKEQRLLLTILGFAFLIPVGGLLIYGAISGDMIWFLVAGILVVGDLIALLVLSRSGKKSGAAKPYLDSVSSLSTDHHAYEEAQAGSETVRAEITGVRNTGVEKGVGRFGTEIELRLLDTDTIGTIRSFFTPAEIAQLTIGREVEVKAVPGHPGAFVLAVGQ